MKLLFKYAGEKKFEFTFCTILAALGALLAIVPYVLIFLIIQHVLAKGSVISTGYLLQLIGWAFLALVGRYVLVIASFVFSHIAAFDLLYIIRSRLARHLGTLPMGYWSKNNSGKVRKVMQEDVETLENFLAHHIPDLVSGLVLPVATIVFLFTIDPRMGLSAVAPLLLGMIVVFFMFAGSRRTEWFRQYHDALEDMHSGAVEFVEGMPVVKAFNVSLDSYAKLKNSVLAYREFIYLISKRQSPYWAVFTGIILGGGIFILPLGFYLLQAGEITVDTLIMFMLLGTGCFFEFIKLIRIISHMEIISEGSKRIEEIMGEASLVEPTLPQTPDLKSIELKDVSFSYDKEAPLVLKNVSAEFPEGSFTAIVGPSGAGKTTLVHLMARMWDVDHGEISIGGIPLKQLGTAGVNQMVGTVFQDVRMLTDSVANNIRMGKSGCSDEEVMEAAETAACHDFILSLPNGYQTIIGDGGEVHLSGGEQQRIALARVILKNPPIILLDEASSYADAENEEKMQTAFSRAMIGKTVVVIAHRLSTIVQADNILVIDEGMVKEQGTHDQLLAEGGLYSRMWGAHTFARHWKLNREEVVA